MIIDVTDTLVIGSWTGIQRVVRKLSQELGRQGDVRLVAALDGHFHELTDAGRVRLFAPDRGPENVVEKNSWTSWLKRAVLRVLRVAPPLYLKMQCASLNRRYRPSLLRYVETEPFVFEADQEVLLIDTFWGGTGAISAARAARHSGAKAYVLVHDLIPISHPQHTSPLVATAFPRRLREAISVADGLLVSSKTGASQLAAQLTKARRKPPICHFYLGSNISTNKRSGSQAATRAARRYVVVGTIEPRKGHAVVLDAFDRLWESGSKDELIFAGRLGWVAENLRRRCAEHRELGHRFHLADRPDDQKLAAIIEGSNALIMASEAEGFGLPVVEALSAGVPVIASDLPIFREIGEKNILYFDYRDPHSLVDAIATFEKDESAFAQLAVDFKWVDWKGSAMQLRQALQEMRSST